MSTLPPDASAEDIDEELAFTAVLIESLDTHADDYQDRLRELEDKRSLYLKMLEGHNTGTQPASERSASDGDTIRYPELPQLDGQALSRLSDSPWSNGFDESPASNSSGSRTSMGVVTSPAAGSSSWNGNNKRPRTQSGYIDVDAHDSKRERGVPGPAFSQDSEAYERARRRQEAIEANLRQMSEDARLAQQLASQSNGRPSMSSSARPNYGGIQTTLNHNGEYRRPQRPPPPSQPERISMPGAFPQPTSSTPFSSHITGMPSWQQSRSSTHQTLPSLSSHLTSMKAEPNQDQRKLVQRPRPDVTANEVIDLTMDDEERAPAPVQHRPQFPARENIPQWSHTPSNWNHHPLQNTTGNMPPGSYSSMPYNKNQGLQSAGTPNGFSSASSLVGRATSFLTNPMQELNNILYGSKSMPFTFDDDDDDVYVSGSRRFNGAYSGNEDLYRSRYDAFAAYDPTKSREEIQALLENIRPDEDMPAHLRVQTPEDMSIRLHKYQELGLTWLQNCEKGSNKGGILADDMGLGKTIQMLSLIVTRKSENIRCKTTLIVAPVALMRQWKQEITQKLKPGRYQLTVFTHHGTSKAKSFDELRKYDVVLTTFGSLAAELKRLEKLSLRRERDPQARPLASEKCVLLDENANWYRVILDEAQCIKNRTTQTSKAACRLKATYRFCMTGTPMMNNVEELFSLIQFLRIKPYCQWEKFRLDFVQPLRSANDDVHKDRAMRMLQTLCKALMLRRTKKSTFEGKPILVLPERTTEMDYPEFDEDEMNFYKALENQTQLEFNKYLRRGTVGTNYSAVLVLLLRLRQACCHPHLIKDFGVSAAADLTPDQMLDLARELDSSVVNRIKESKGSFECPVCYDVTPNPAIFIPCGHDTCSECFARIADPANAIQTGDEGARARCPNCRGPIDAKRLTDFASFKRVHMPELLTEAERQEDGGTFGDDDSEDDSSETESSDEDDDDGEDTKSLNGFIVNDEEVDDDVKDEPNDDDETDDDLDKPAKLEWIEERPASAGPAPKADGDNEIGLDAKPEGSSSKQRDTVKGKDKKRSKGKGKGKEKKKKKSKPQVTLAELKKAANRNTAARKAYLRRLRKDWVSSAKIDKTMDLLQNIMNGEEGEKILIFSQWTSLLDLLEIPIDNAGWGYRRYDGSMSAKTRGDAVDDFRDTHKNVRIMLISLKAGNAGLNLNMASQVIILDPFWNPYIEEQAIDRAHRIGQVRTVTVHRVLIQGTVEDRIIELQEKKRALISQALDEKSGSALARLGVQELAYLFGVSANPAQNVARR